MSGNTRVPLAEVCTIVGGGTPRRSNAAYFEGTIPWATPTDVTSLDSLHIGQTKEAITDTALRESSARLLPAGTVLMTSRATIGYTAIAALPMATNQGFANLICGKRIAPEYLAFWLRDQRERLIELAGGTTFREITKSTLKKVRIPLPPLDEQRRIVAILNRAAKIERLRARAGERLREFIPALFIRMFGDPAENPMGWEVARIGDVCEINPRSRRHDFPEDVLVSFVSMDSVDEKYGTIKARKARPLSEVSKGYTRFQEGDVLFAKITPCMENGKTALAQGLINGIGRGSTEFHILRPGGRVLGTYIHQFIRQMWFREEAKRSFTGTAGQQRVPKSFLEMALIPLPPLDQQRSFSAAIERIMSTVHSYAKADTDSAALTASLMDRLLGDGA